MNKIICTVTISALVLLFTGCVKQPKFDKAKIDRLKTSHDFDRKAKKDGVTVGIKVISSQDCKDIFEKDLHANSVYPIALNFKNKSSNSYTFSKKSLTNLNIMEHDAIYKTLQKTFSNCGTTSVAKAAFAPAGVALGVATGVAIASLISASSQLYILYPFAVAGAIITLPVIFTGTYLISLVPMSIFWNISKNRVNNQIKDFIHESVLLKDIAINSGSNNSVIIFSKNLPADFELTLFNGNNAENLVFNINL